VLLLTTFRASRKAEDTLGHHLALHLSQSTECLL
jgi:hypothetical protein